MTDNLTDYYAMESDLEGVESGLPDLPMSEVPTPVPETTADHYIDIQINGKGLRNE